MSLPSEPDPAKKPAKSKLDSVSREELIKLLKKQMDLCKQGKMELEALRKEKEGEAKRAEEAERKLEDLGKVQKSDCNSVPSSDHEETAAELLAKATVMEMELKIGELNETVRKLETQIDTMKKRSKDDAEASRMVQDELRSQLNDAREEIVTMRESRNAADVFSLEMADYERKVEELTRSSKEAIIALDKCTTERDELQQEIEKMKIREQEITTDHEKKTSELADVEQKMRDFLIENEKLKDRAQSAAELIDKSDLSKKTEIENLSACLAREVQKVQNLQDTLERLQITIDQVRSDRDANVSRAEELEKDFEAFKKKTKFVLEHQAKPVQKEDNSRVIEEMEKRIEEYYKMEQKFRDDLSSRDSEILQLGSRIVRAESERDKQRRESDEAQIELSLKMDELRELRSQNEKLYAEKLRDQQLYKGMIDGEQSQSSELKQREAKLTETLSSLRSQLEVKEKQLTEEKRVKEELKKQLEEQKADKIALRQATPSRTTYPFLSAESIRSSSPIIDDQASNTERSLEDVLFGDEQFIEPNGSCNQQQDPAHMYTQLMHTQSILAETEENASRLLDQNSLLKAEIRRLERNEQRKEHAENTEYMKNVVLKFLTPEKVSGEKAQLLPILSKMLQLSKDENDIILQAIANEESPPTASNSSFGAMIHRWSGLS